MTDALPELIFPAFDVRTEASTSGVRIYDAVRRQYVALTPEEWVRQHCIHWLISRGYPLGRCSVEKSLQIGSETTMRYDVLWMDDQLNPFLLIECKAPTLALTDAVVRQSAWYNHTLKAPFIFMTNGRSAFCYQRQPDGTLQPCDDIPTYPSQNTQRS